LAPDGDGRLRVEAYVDGAWHGLEASPPDFPAEPFTAPKLDVNE
jgi:hypothetical protein